MTVAAIKTSESVIRWHYLPWALLAIAVMVAAIVADNLWFSAPSCAGWIFHILRTVCL
jgi:hypothetical protein